MELNARELDNYITGHYGEDQYGAEYQKNELNYDQPEDLDDPEPEVTFEDVTRAWEKYNTACRSLFHSCHGGSYNPELLDEARSARSEWSRLGDIWQGS